MMTVKHLVQTCNNEYKWINLYKDDEGMIGAYTSLDKISEARQDAIVRTWAYNDNTLYIRI